MTRAESELREPGIRKPQSVPPSDMFCQFKPSLNHQQVQMCCKAGFIPPVAAVARFAPQQPHRLHIAHYSHTAPLLVLVTLTAHSPALHTPRLPQDPGTTHDPAELAGGERLATSAEQSLLLANNKPLPQQPHNVRAQLPDGAHAAAQRTV